MIRRNMDRNLSTENVNQFNEFVKSSRYPDVDNGSETFSNPAIVSNPSSPEGQSIQSSARVSARISGHRKVIFPNPYPVRESA